MKSDNHKRYLELREKYPEFVFDGFSIRHSSNSIHIRFFYNAGTEFKFCSKWKVNFGSHFNYSSLLPDINNTVLNLGMIEMLSYWKAFCSPVITTALFKLNDEQKAWWMKLFRFGLAEFFHVNNIPQPADDFFKFKSTPKAQYYTKPVKTLRHSQLGNKVLVPVGGGKDSIAGLRIVTESGKKPVPFVLNPREATDKVIKVAGFEPHECITIDRQLDPLLLELNDKGFLNGHTPFSALLAFAAAFAAQRSEITDIALSNESSANEATIPGTKINHQYSKSFEFENDFRNYVYNCIDEGINYFSLLRPLNELQIAERFSQNNEFFEAFKSCNAGSKNDLWCCKCSKCLFTFVILSPFIPIKKLTEIFGNNLFDDAGLLPILEALAGITPEKPFECVGTIDDVNMALVAAIKKHYPETKSLPILLEHYKNSSLYANYEKANVRDYLDAINEEHCVPEDYLRLLVRKKIFKTSIHDGCV